MGDNTLTEIVLKDGDVVFFTTKTCHYGIAVFDVCPVVKGGKLKEIFITPRQQPDAKHYYRISIEGSCNSWGVDAWTQYGISYPKVRRLCWCKEHGCQSMRVCVPPESNCFEVALGSNVTLYFNRAKREECSTPA